MRAGKPFSVSVWVPSAGTRPGTLGTPMRVCGPEFIHLCQPPAPQRPNRPLAKVELEAPPAWPGRGWLCAWLPFAGSGATGLGGGAEPLALCGGWAVGVLGSLLPVMASFSKAFLSRLAPREGGMTQTSSESHCGVSQAPSGRGVRAGEGLPGLISRRKRRHFGPGRMRRVDRCAHWGAGKTGRAGGGKSNFE